MKTKYSNPTHEQPEGNGLIIAMLVTAAISAGIAILYAPKSGKETRDQIKDLADKQKDNVKDQINRSKEKAMEAVGTVKDKYAQVTEQAKSKLESFKQKEVTAQPADFSQNDY